MMATIVRATKSFQWKNFLIHAGNRMLLDNCHLNHDVFMPRHGMTHIPFLEWIEKGWLQDEGQSPTKMFVRDLDGLEQQLEPMFAFIKRGWEDAQPIGDMVGAEVGVFEGANAERILKALPIKKLYLIDSYGTTLSYQYNNPDLKAAQKKAHQRLQPWADKTEWMERDSHFALWMLRNHELDFCYHDSDHRRPCVERELPLGYATVAVGGVWGGHDYKNTVEGECEVKSCVDEFFIDHELSNLWYSSTKLNWWHVKGRT